METLAITKKEQNISLVQTAFADFANGNIQGIADACTEDITWGSYHHPAVPYSGTFHGRSGVIAFFASLASSLDYKAVTPNEFYADGDTVLVRGYHEAMVKATGKTFGHDFIMHFSLLDGKVSGYFAFVDIYDQVVAFTS
jgi:uncharacterized protein